MYSLIFYFCVIQFFYGSPVTSLPVISRIHTFLLATTANVFSTELFAVFIITLPAGLVGYLLQLPILFPNIINLFELLYSFPYFSNETVISLPFSMETFYPTSHSFNIFLILCTLSPHTPFACSPGLCLTALIYLPLNTS